MHNTKTPIHGESGALWMISSLCVRTHASLGISSFSTMRESAQHSPRPGSLYDLSPQKTWKQNGKRFEKTLAEQLNKENPQYIWILIE